MDSDENSPSKYLIGHNIILREHAIISEDTVGKRIAQMMNMHVSHQKDSIYYEILLNDLPPHSTLCIGFSHNDIPMNKHFPGYIEGSWGLTNTGELYLGSKVPHVVHNVQFSQGDTIGCGIIGNTLFWTCKRELILRVFLLDRDRKLALYPTVGFSRDSSVIFDPFAHCPVSGIEESVPNRDGTVSYFSYKNSLWDTIFTKKGKLKKIKNKIAEANETHLSSYYHPEGCTLVFMVIRKLHEDRDSKEYYQKVLESLASVQVNRDVLNINARDDRNEFPLFYLCKKGDAESINLLSNLYNLDFLMWSNSGTALHAVAREGNLDLVELLVKEIDINSQQHSSSATPLFCAAACNQTSVVRYLINNNADPSLADSSGQTPLYTSLEMQSYECAQILIEVTEKDVVDENGNTFLHVAARIQNLEICSKLLSPYTINKKNNRGYSPLHLATQYNNLTLIKLLLENGADVDDRVDIIEWTPLHFAAENGSDSICSSLISFNADVDAKSFKNETPLSLAYKKGNQNCVDLLIDHGAHQEISIGDTQENAGLTKSISENISNESLNGLLYKLAPVQLFDEEYVTQFLNTYLLFTSTEEVLDFLLNRYEFPQELLLFKQIQSDDQSGEEIIKYRVRLRILLIFETWTKRYPEDFTDDLYKKIMTKLMDISTSNTELRTKAISSMKNLLKHLERYDFLITGNLTTPISFAHSIRFSKKKGKRKSLSGSFLLEYPSEEIAQSLSVIQYELLSKIKPRDILNKAISGSSESMSKMIEYGNKISLFFVNEILKGGDIKIRSLYFEKVLEISDILLGHNNIYGHVIMLLTVLSVFINSSVVYPKELSLRDKIDVVTNQTRFVDILENSTPPVVPFLAPLDKALIFIVDGNTIYEENNGVKLINFKTMQLISKQITIYCKNYFSDCPGYEFTGVSELIDILKTPHTNEEQIKNRLDSIKQEGI
eukprot:TRINITY_DN1596_c0_g2_i4.p1 TRINITY_DN1596_c0_g2~~TRINITY_DN1596_c0_g2_i4.p1  ORF type:complete len:948 (+),score=164.28 TRINITY_DN1596_c0_g2_i4:83-2926(+)